MAVTIKTIAKETGLSLTTVSKYLNGGNVLAENKALIEASIKKNGYRVNYIAKTLKTGQTNTIGVVLPSFQDVFHTQLFHYLEYYLQRKGYSIQIVGSGGTLETEKNTTFTKELIALFDVLVDGAYVEELKDIRLKFRGSANQRVINVQKTLEKGECVPYLE